MPATRKYSAATAQTVEVAFTEEELGSMLEDVERPAGPRGEQEPASVASGGTKPGVDERLARIQAKVEAQVDEKTRLRTTKQSYLITRHLTHTNVRRDVISPDSTTAPLIYRFGKLLGQPDPDLDHVWSAYIRIPAPRVQYIQENDLTTLLTLIRRVRTKEAVQVQRYFTIMDDMAASGRPLTHRDMTSAMHWIGRSKACPPAVGLGKALSIFHEFERRPHMYGNVATFNTLGYLALKAKHYPTVREVLDIMTDRHLQYDRYTHLLRISYAGKTKSVTGIREAYRAMLAAGELIDTVVLNCTIRASLDAADVRGAETTLVRMKTLHASKRTPPVPPVDWEGGKRLGVILHYAAWQLRHHHKLRDEMQDATPVSPNSHTYRMLIDHHAFVTGDFDRITELLYEVMDSGLKVELGTWAKIFRGFERHEQIKLGGWTRSGFQKVWHVLGEYLKASAGVAVTNELVQAVMEAWDAKGTEEELKSAVDSIRREWQLAHDAEAPLTQALEKAERRRLRMERGQSSDVQIPELPGDINRHDRKGSRRRNRKKTLYNDHDHAPALVENHEWGMLWPDGRFPE